MKKLILIIALILSNFAFSQEGIFDDGTIKVFSYVPRVWKGENGFKSTTFEYRYTKGFRQVVQPTMTIYQKRDTIYFDVGNDYFTYAIKDFTQDEIDVYDQRQLDIDISAKKENQFKEDGEIAYNRIKHRLRRALDTGFLTPTEFDQIYKPIRQKIVWLNTGDWDIAKENIDAIGVQTGNKLIVLDKIKEIIDNYILENY